jgi:class 3 adenylate cyclase
VIATSCAIKDWLEHRSGVRRSSSFPFQVHRRALELNKRFDELSLFGNREIKAIVGFVDLVGFSESIANSSPREISSFLHPFLSGVIDATTRAQGLVDKSIGDEIMLILPDLEEGGGIAVEFNFQFLLSQLDTLQLSLGSSYRFHMGFAFGLLYLDYVHGEGYNEWTFAGRTIILAKRLAALPRSEQCGRFDASFGVLNNENNLNRFGSILQFVANDVSLFEPRPISATGLKGIKETTCVRLSLRSPN